MRPSNAQEGAGYKEASMGADDDEEVYISSLSVLFASSSCLEYLKIDCHQAERYDQLSKYYRQ